jgi:hypothetical protein
MGYVIVIKIDRITRYMRGIPLPFMSVEPNPVSVVKHVRTIPYWLEGTTLSTFELHEGGPSAERIPIGTYQPESDSIEFFPDWRERCQSRLDAYRASLVGQDRGPNRSVLLRPAKSRVSARNSRAGNVSKSASGK